ncbi:hypothetical protein LC605_17935 [Nostoc sp. CHAB 5836]|nr:hypothetical protein [Nostoc sp. CHAB 5836]
MFDQKSKGSKSRPFWRKKPLNIKVGKNSQRHLLDAGEPVHRSGSPEVSGLIQLRISFLLPSDSVRLRSGRVEVSRGITNYFYIDK